MPFPAALEVASDYIELICNYIFTVSFFLRAKFVLIHFYLGLLFHGQENVLVPYAKVYYSPHGHLVVRTSKYTLFQVHLAKINVVQ